MLEKRNSVILCVLDGWGVSNEQQGNAILSASTPCWDELVKQYPYSELIASGEEVGLPENQIGNSEVGHMTLGAGRVILQDIMKINDYIAKDLFYNSKCLDQIKKCQELHIFGLCSDGGVHGHIDHLLYFTDVILECNINIKLHLILDGRDVAPSSGLEFVNNVIEKYKNIPNVTIASICGRYYAMDRDNRWDRVDACYQAVMLGSGEKVKDFISAIEDNYKQNITDEFIKPLVNIDYNGVDENAALFITNFRADRVIQIASAFAGIGKYGPNKKFKQLISMKKYSDELASYYLSITQQESYQNSLGQVIADNQLKQLRLAETEKYAHVTYFFNLNKQQEFLNETRWLVNSPNVNDYLDTPAMSSLEITDKLIESINASKYDFILVNFAAPDMIGHTGNMDSAIKAVEVIDSCLKKISDIALEQDITLIITSDHGNCEAMIDKDGNNITAHTTNKVPVIIVKKNLLGEKDYLYQQNIGLKDVAPTILSFLGIEKPEEMTGSSLIKKRKNI
jgi:2,3-bisphosphoglycerate-independent phosphoglycerate mutase